MIEYILYTVGLGLAFVIAGSVSAKNVAATDFILNSFVAVIFANSYVKPYYDPHMPVFQIIAFLVVGIGGMVGGVVGALLPKISSGISAGFLTALFICGIIFPMDNAVKNTFYISAPLFILMVVLWLYMAQIYQSLTFFFRIAIGSGLLFAVCVDGFTGTGLQDTVENLIRMESAPLVCNPSCSVDLMFFVWTIFSLYTCLIQAYRRDYIKFLTNRFSRNSIRQKIGDNVGIRMASLHQTGAESVPSKQKTFSYPDSLVTNFYDPDRPPLFVQAFASLVIPIAQRIAFLHGFQVDNSRNQAEHVIMLLSNDSKPTKDNPMLAACFRLHQRLFQNYTSWCDRMGAAPIFCPKNNGAVHLAYLEDIIVFFLVWGEAANLRHCPESLCFLYHKVMEEHVVLTTTFGISDNTSSLESTRYPGYFLDMVVTPLYDVVADGMKGGQDHHERKTYDDYNEFFWSPSCLKYSIHDDDYPIVSDNSFQYQSLGVYSEEKPKIHVSAGLHSAKKTYIEKRSWLHPIFSLRRIFEWHVLTFTILMSWAYAHELQWPYAFTVQVASFAFLEISLLNIVWTSLEVWTLYPNTSISLSSVAGYLIRLLAGYLVLVYQSLYYHWSFILDQSDPTFQTGNIKSVNLKEPMFWWWQYAWLSLIALFFYVLESVLCWYPSIISRILSVNDDVVQSFLNICYPFSQLYVGKVVHVDQKHVWWYIIFWVPLILFKLWFGYCYVIHPVTIPSIELFDDYMNFQKISFLKTSVLMFLWWFPHFLVYIIDLSIWYSVWISIVGGFVALSERQGAVRDSKSFRNHFIKSPLAFSQRLLDENSAVFQSSSGISASTASLSHLEVLSKEQVTDSYPKPSSAQASSQRSSAYGSRALSTADLANFNLVNDFKKTEKSSVVNDGLNNNRSIDAVRDLRSHDSTIKPTNEAVTEFLSHVSNQRWILFSRVWNEIIIKLRAADHISNIERDRLSFSNFSWLSKPVYLPSFQTAGCVMSMIHSYRQAASDYSSETEPEKKIAVIEKFYGDLDVTSSEAAAEAWELITWLITRLLGTMHGRDIESVVSKLNFMKKSNNIFGFINPDSLGGLMNHSLNIVNLLKNSLRNRKNNLIITAEVLKREEENRLLLKSGNRPDTNNLVAQSTGSKMKKSVSSGFLQGLDMQPSVGKKAEAQKFTKLKPFRQSTFVLTDTTRDKLREELRGLLQGLKSAITTSTAHGCWSKEDVGKLTFIQSFESGFFWSDVYASQSIDEMSQDNRCIDVVMKLHDLLTLRQADADPSSAEARRRLNFFINSLFMPMPAPPPIKLSHEYTCMTPYYSEDVLLTRSDLESKNSDGISTLLYLQTLYNKDWMNFLERRNIKDEQLIWSKEHAQETRMWASLRSQTLFRTVEGMMSTESAIKLLSEIEQIDKEEAELLSQLKFNYVVACQVYGQMKKNLESKADDIEFLLMRYPNLRVAYIDTIRTNRTTDDGNSVIDVSFYSVLIKFDPIDKKIKEVFRLKLPGNPVLGEGKPENQNHAIVFSRGRYLQAIDMNQEGYFEESLKMRNLLQEFDISGCAILGFREHIFTGSVSSVANYMALQELSFVSLGQRVLTNPLMIRQHYGHPDFFDKLFVMTEGGMSKASKGINLSEDVFAGFNATIRGHFVNFKEYAHVGKGRDVGLQQTYKFEAKLSQGNAEQSISRDIDRICDRLDFFRLFSFYYGGIGHYISNALIMMTLVVVVDTMLALAIYGEEGVNGRAILPEGVFQLILAGMGVLQTFPLAVTLTVERGFVAAFSELVYMMISGGPLYFIFHIGTKSYYFQQTLLAGGATYRPTGRGFVIRHSPFDENYRFFASSHIYLGFELAVDLVLLAMYTKSKQYFGLTWSLWMAAIAFLMGPFWFNPVSFEWDKVVEDYGMWIRWMTETGGGSSEQSWDTWWKEDNSFFRKLSPSWKIFLLVVKCGPWIALGIGLFGFRFWRSVGEQLRVLEVVGLYTTYFFGNWLIAQQERRLSYAVRRFSSLMLSAAVLSISLYLFISHTLYFRYAVAFYFFGASVAFMSLIMFGVNSSPVNYIYKLHDYLVGHALFAVIGLLTVLQFGYLQTWLLYHNALSHGVVNDDILKFAKKSREKALDERETISSLEKKLVEQEKRIQTLLVSSHDSRGTNGEKGIEIKEKSPLLGDMKRSTYGSGESQHASSNITFSVTPGIASRATDTSANSLRTTLSPASLPVRQQKEAVDLKLSSHPPLSTALPPVAEFQPTAATLSGYTDFTVSKPQTSTTTQSLDSKSQLRVGSYNPEAKLTLPTESAGAIAQMNPSASLPTIPKSSSHSTSANASWDSSRSTQSSGNASTTTSFVFKQPDKFPKRDA